MNTKLILTTCITGFFTLANAQEEKQIEEVSITSKSTQSIAKNNKNITLITEKDLENHKGQNLTEIISQVAGFQISGNFNDVAEKTLRVRGGNNQTVLILIDGTPLKDVTGSSFNVADLRFFGTENIEKIEILRDASSVLYGSNAATAVIDIKTKKHGQKPIQANVGLKGGSYATFGQNANIGGSLGKFHYQISGNNEKSDGYSTAEGENFDKDGFERQNLNAKFGIDLKNFNFTVNGGWNHHLFLYDTGAYTDGNYRANNYQTYIGTNANLLYFSNKGELTLNTRVSGNERIGQELNTNLYKDSYKYQGQNIFVELFNKFNFNQNITLSIGGQYEDQRLEYQSVPWGNTEMQTYLQMSDTNINSWEFFANANLSYSIFNLDSGVRYIKHSKFGQHWVYQISPYFYHKFDSFFAKLGYSFATAFIAPTLYQSYGDGVYTTGNPNLEPETNQNHEINFSLGKSDRSLVFNASIFHRKEKDIFVYSSNPITYIGKYENIDENKAKGIELSIDYQANTYLGFGGNYSFVEKENEASMLRQPKQRVNSYVSITPFTGTKIHISHIFVGKRNDAFYNPASFVSENVSVADFNLFNININQKITENLSFYGNIDNIFDKKYIDNIGYKTRGINFMIGVDYKF